MSYYASEDGAPVGQTEARGRHMLYVGDCLDLIRALPDNSVDAVVTDPPYGLEFMGKEWDAPWKDDRTDTRGVVDPTKWGGTQDGPSGGNAYSRARIRTGAAHYGGDAAKVGRQFQTWCGTWLTECLRVLKPGGHLVAFGGTRTYHRLACAAEDAGFEIRDSLMWCYGSGFPKSLSVGKAIDKAAGAVREVIGPSTRHAGQSYQWAGENMHPTHSEDKAAQTAPATPEAAAWEGWGTALKPAYESIVLARKPLTGAVAANVLRHGTGAINVDGCRVETNDALSTHSRGAGYAGPAFGRMNPNPTRVQPGQELGRWPPNVLLDGEAAAMLDASAVGEPARFYPQFAFDDAESTTLRFCYSAKTSKAERGEGNKHPTVKPLALMRWLARLVTPPGGTILEPFGGSGTTILAGEREGFTVIAAEKSPEYAAMIRLRWTGRAAVFARQDKQTKKPKGD